MDTKEKNDKKAKKYVEARLRGLKKVEARKVSGYSETTPIVQIEKPGGPVANLMQRALDIIGIDEEFIAKEYQEGLALSKSPAASEADCNAHAKYLLQLGYLRGYGRNGPSVAVQINNNPGSNTPNDVGRVENTLREVGELLRVVREELSEREPRDVSTEDNPVAGGSIVHVETSAHPGVVPPNNEA